MGNPIETLSGQPGNQEDLGRPGEQEAPGDAVTIGLTV